MIRKEQLYEQILEQIDLTKETDDEELQELIRTVLVRQQMKNIFR